MMNELSYYQFLMITPCIYFFFGVQSIYTEEVCAEKCLKHLEFIYNILLQQSFIFLAGLV